ncbi:MAG: hypothetical protein Q8R90_09520 [Bacteroidales bacterium]|nr:hypothetical protein [Bacteroidales bacterium]
MKRLILSVALIIMAATISCEKGEKNETPGWIALSFTMNPSDKYLLYMDDPHVNLTLPAISTSSKVDFADGMWHLDGTKYVLAAHNWGEREIIIQIYRNGILEKELSAAPLADIPGAHDNHIKRFNLSFETTPGEYTFSASMSHNGEITPLYTHTMHGTQNRMVVK